MLALVNACDPTARIQSATWSCWMRTRRYFCLWHEAELR